MASIRTTNNRKWRMREPFFLVKETYTVDGKDMEEMMRIQNGWALRHSPKQGTPAHFAPNGDELVWTDPDATDVG